MTEKLETKMAEIATDVTHIKDDVKEIKESMATKESVTLRFNNIKGTLSLHLTLIIAIIVGIVSMGLWWMRTGAG